jgi:hypothetical protein
MLLKALDAEQFRADRFFRVSGKSCRWGLQSAKKREIQTCLSVRKTRQKRCEVWLNGRFI